MKKRGEVRKSVMETEGPTTIFPLITDLIFVSIAVYLVLDYARALLTQTDTPLFILREGILILYLLMALLLLTFRNGAKTFTRKRVDYVYTILGFSSPLLFQPAPWGGPFLFGAFLEFVGLVLVVGAFVSLGRSFGLAPENRGIKTVGAYRFVRHPMYLGYILAEAGYIFDNFSNINVFVFMISVVFLLLRLRAEERLLQNDRVYRRYATRARWRLLPLVF